MNKDNYKTLIRNITDRKMTEEELKEYEELEKEFLGDPVKKTGIYAEKEENSMTAKKKIGPKKIIGKMKLADAIHAVEADYPGTVFYVGSESSYFFIGTAEEFDNDIAKICEECKKQFHKDNIRTSEELRRDFKKLSIICRNDEFSEKIYNLEEELTRNIAKTAKYYDAYHNWVDIQDRTVKDCYIRDSAGEFNDGGLVMIVPGYETGKWSFYHEYKSKTIQHEPNTVYIPKEE